MFGKPRVSKEYASVIEKLESGERRRPEHRRPRSVTDSGFDSFATTGVIAVFEGFEYFGALLNRQVSDPWTVEETAETLVMDYRGDSPELGRTYVLFFNGVRVGRVQVTEGFNEAGGFRETLEWHRVNRAARVLIDIDYLRFIPFDDALSIISAIELFLGNFEDGNAARLLAKLKASAALTAYLWEVVRADDGHVPRFDHRVEGPYDLLKQTTERWKAEGIDPFVRWNGDRPE